MFDLGTKVILIASSCNKKTGPRKSSVGYITSSNEYVSEFAHKQMIVNAATIRFLRYGNEKRVRFETKQVLLVFPIISSNAESGLDTFINVIKSDKFAQNYNTLRHNAHLAEDTPIVMAVPMYRTETNFKSCTKEEFYCWFESCLFSQQMNEFVNKVLVTNHLFKSNMDFITRQDLLLLQTMTVDKHTRYDVLNVIHKNSTKRINWIHILRIITITIQHIEQQRTALRLHEVMEKGLYNKGVDGLATEKAVYNRLIPHIFQKDFSAIKFIFKGSIGFTKTIEKMEAIKKAMLVLSTKN